MRSTLRAIWLLVPDPFSACGAPCGPYGYWQLPPFFCPLREALVTLAGVTYSSGACLRRVSRIFMRTFSASILIILMVVVPVAGVSHVHCPEDPAHHTVAPCQRHFHVHGRHVSTGSAVAHAKQHVHALPAALSAFPRSTHDSDACCVCDSLAVEWQRLTGGHLRNVRHSLPGLNAVSAGLAAGVSALPCRCSAGCLGRAARTPRSLRTLVIQC